MPASATPAGPATAAQPELNAEPGNDGDQRSEVGGRKPAGERSEEDGESQNPTEVSNEELARHLNLPAGVTEELKKGEARTKDTKDAKAKAKVKPEGPAGEEQSGEEESGSQEVEDEESAAAEASADSSSREDASGEEADHEHDDDDDAAEGIPQFIKGIADPKLRKKLEKRFGRMTRKSARLEEALERQEQELGAYRERQGGAQAHQAANGTPQALGEVRSEQNLDQLIAYHEAVIDLATQNPDGVQIGEGDAAKFLPPEELATLRRGSEKFMRGSERRRRELREHAAQRQSYDAQAIRDFPEVMKKDTPEFQTAVKLAGRYPWVCQLPEANYALGLMVEGFKALNGRVSKSKSKNGANGAGGNNEDLDERLTPEYQRENIPPTAAAIPNKPQRSPASAGLNAKKADQIAKNFTRPQGATTANLASAFEALDEEDESPSRRRVAV